MAKNRGLDVIHLFSGGLDSSLAFIRLVREGYRVQPIFVDYGQWPSKSEYDAVLRVLARSRYYNSGGKILVREPVKIDLDWNEPVESVWGRSIALVGIAAMWAYTHGNHYGYISMGVHEGDVGPDCKPGEFTEALSKTLEIATKGQMTLLLPIEDLDIKDIGRELGAIGVPWEDVYSCYWDPPCGYRSSNDTYRCPGCRRKVIAMEEAGVKDQRLERPNCPQITYQSDQATPTGY